MAKFERIENLLGELYKHRNLFTALFDKRMFPIQEEMVLPLVDHDTEKLERLAAFDLLFRNQSQISLESRLQEFFEEFLEVDETVHVLYIQENLNQIKINQSYYLVSVYKVGSFARGTCRKIFSLVFIFHNVALFLLFPSFLFHFYLF